MYNYLFSLLALLSAFGTFSQPASPALTRDLTCGQLVRPI